MEHAYPTPRRGRHARPVPVEGGREVDARSDRRGARVLAVVSSEALRCGAQHEERCIATCVRRHGRRRHYCGGSRWWRHVLDCPPWPRRLCWLSQSWEPLSSQMLRYVRTPRRTACRHSCTFCMELAFRILSPQVFLMEQLKLQIHGEIPHLKKEHSRTRSKLPRTTKKRERMKTTRGSEDKKTQSRPFRRQDKIS